MNPGNLGQVMVESPVAAPYTEAARAYLRLLLGERSDGSPEALAKALADHAALRLHSARYQAALDLLEGERVLDIGCEIGVLTKALAPHVREVLAMDIRPETIEIARRAFGAPNIEYRVGNPFESDLPDGAFDAIVFVETLEHVEDPVGCLRQIHRMLRPQGVLLLSTPNPLSYHEWLRQVIRLWPSWRTDSGIRRVAAKVAAETAGVGTEEDHLYSWTWETLSRLLHRCGFCYEDHRRAGFAAPSLPIGSKRFWPLGRRELLALRPLVGPFCQTLFFKVRAVTS